MIQDWLAAPVTRFALLLYAIIWYLARQIVRELRDARRARQHQ